MAKKGQKKVKQKESVNTSKTPRHTENPEAFLDRNPIWSFKLVDNNYDKWGFIHCENIYNDIIIKLADYEGMTWDEILKATGGKKCGNNNHYEPVSSLTKEAQKRWIDLKLDQYDQIFSLRITGKKRLYGILNDRVFRIVWFDQKHEICPTCK